MNIHSTKQTLKKELSSIIQAGKTIGFVPTMGALHQGHLSLVKKSLQQNDYTVVSIFVNPTQFDNATDLKKYPRTLKKDVELLQTVSKKIIVFAPEAASFYEGEVLSKSFDFDGLEHQMEGKHRNGHFDGVATVVSLLFNAVQPTVAYFGEKDFQQLQVIKKLVEKEKLPVLIQGCDIVREADGLAMSSRNKRLSTEHRKAAPFIFQTLQEVKKNFHELSLSQLRNLVQIRFKKHPLLELEYFEIANERTLKPAFRKTKNNTYRAFLAVYAGDIRLIDNCKLN